MTECIISTDGTRRWYKDGRLHRIDGPAAEFPNGARYWFSNGKLHCIGGPAVELADGSIAREM